MNDLQFNVVTLLLVDGTEMLVRAEDVRTVRRCIQTIQTPLAAGVLRSMDEEQRVRELRLYENALNNAVAGGTGVTRATYNVAVGQDFDRQTVAVAPRPTGTARPTCLVRVNGYGNDFTVLNPYEELDRWMRNS